RAFPRGRGPVAFSPDGKVLATAGEGHAVSLWDAGTGELRRSLKGKPAGLLKVSPHGKAPAGSGGGGGGVSGWGPRAGRGGAGGAGGVGGPGGRRGLHLGGGGAWGGGGEGGGEPVGPGEGAGRAVGEVGPERASGLRDKVGQASRRGSSPGLRGPASGYSPRP